MKACRFLLTIVLLLMPLSASAVEHVSIKRDGKPIHLSGKIVVEAVNGGLLLMTPDSTLWVVQPEEIVRRKTDALPFQLLKKEKIAEQLKQEMGSEFKIHHTAHYLICYNTSRAYAQWCGALYERLYRAFPNYWGKLGFPLRDPGMPLVALVFDDKDSYAQFARRELGEAVGLIPAYFSERTNRVLMYDLTGSEGLGNGRRGSTTRHINQILSKPQASAMVSNIVHEATHQLAFNGGLQTRYADNPKWVSEGIAIYFESPDLKSSTGWRGIGKIHRRRLLQFKQYLRNRPENSLETLLQDNKRFNNLKTMRDAYPEAWALNYYLIKTRGKDYVRYLQQLSKKKQVVYDQPHQRVAQFKAIFGNDLKEFDADFVRYMRKLGR